MSEPKRIPDPSEPEPAWIRDLNAAKIDLNVHIPEALPRAVERICEGEKIHCEYCGEPLPFWPPKQFADHVLTKHPDIVTIQIRTGMGLLCDDQFNEHMQMFFWGQFQSRVSIRRRAWQLGLVTAKVNPPIPFGSREVS